MALEALKGEKTLAQISSEYSVHANLISRWKQELLKGLPEVFNQSILIYTTMNGFMKALLIKRLPRFIWAGHGDRQSSCIWGYKKTKTLLRKLK